MKVQQTVQEKINTALAVFSFALIAVPLGIQVSRRETSANLGVSVLLVLSYYLLTYGWLARPPSGYRPAFSSGCQRDFFSARIWLFNRIERR